MGYDRKLSQPECADEGCVIVPFCFTVNGVTHPDAVLGDQIYNRLVTRTSAGLFTFTLVDKPVAVVGGSVCMSSGATEDIGAHLDASLATTTGVVTVRTITTTTATDPADDTIVYGQLICKKTDRRAGA